MKTKILINLLCAFLLCSCSDFLVRPPLDKIENNPKFWSTESNVRNYTYGLYDIYFTGYESGWVRSDFYDGTTVAEWTDDLAQQTSNFFLTVAPPKSEFWSFENVRRINTMIEGVTSSSLPTNSKNHWLGIAHFFRALEYSALVRKFGDVPYFDRVLKSTDVEELYKPRDSRSFVMDRVMEDLEFASDNVLVSDGVNGLVVNKAVVDAFTSRILLFEGTWQKYNMQDADDAKRYLTAAMEGAERIMALDKFIISDSYMALTTSVDLAQNKEMILYRQYVAGINSHFEMTSQFENEHRNGPSKDLVESFLSNNGLPINQVGNTIYKGDKSLKDEMTDRDPRLLYNVSPTNLELNGLSFKYSISGYAATRFINENLVGTPDGMSNTNVTDAPIMKYNEVLLNYIEAAAELSDLGVRVLMQSDLDKSFNLIRGRNGVDMPNVTLSGSSLSVNNIAINDPDRDSDVSPIIWEVRRERRVELCYEGIRFDDIRRWGKLDYADMVLNLKLNLGAWLNKPEFIAAYNLEFGTDYDVAALESITLDRAGDAGYIKPIPTVVHQREYSDKDYLYPIPRNEISLYLSKSKELGNPKIKLTPNPGW